MTQEMLYKMAKSRFDEAQILLENKKLDGAVYLVGYALELILKLRIVRTLNWDSYPNTGKDFEKYKSFKVHDLETLLHLSGLEKKLRANNELLARWNIAKSWDSEIRYRDVGNMSNSEARDTIEATRYIINFLLKEKLYE